MIWIIIVYSLCAYGLSNIIVYSSGPFNIFSKLREYSNKVLPSNLGELFECMICFPTWVGILFSIIDIFLLRDISFTPFNLIFNDNNFWYIIILLDSFFTSGTTWLLHTIQESFEKRIDE